MDFCPARRSVIHSIRVVATWWCLLQHGKDKGGPSVISRDMEEIGRACPSLTPLLSEICGGMRSEAPQPTFRYIYPASLSPLQWQL